MRFILWFALLCECLSRGLGDSQNFGGACVHGLFGQPEACACISARAVSQHNHVSS